MQKRNLIVLMAFIIKNVFAVSESLIPMSKKQIEQEILNKTLISIPTDNLNGKTINNTFSMYMDNKKTVLGKMQIKPMNQPQSDIGEYSILSDGTVYFTWQHWDMAKKLCFHIYQTANSYISIGCDQVFHTAFMKSNIQIGNHLQ